MNFRDTTQEKAGIENQALSGDYSETRLSLFLKINQDIKERYLSKIYE
jgi:hypothetical protein